MNLEQAEKQRVIRIYNIAQAIVVEEVASGFPMLHALGRTEQHEERNSWTKFGANALPQGDILTRWKTGVAMNHRAAYRLLGEDLTLKRDFFPAPIKPSSDNNWIDEADDYLSYPDVFLGYSDMIKHEIKWDVLHKNSVEKVSNGVTEEKRTLEYLYRESDWIVHPEMQIHGKYDKIYAKSEKCFVSLSFRVFREDQPQEMQSQTREVLSRTGSMEVFSPATFLGLLDTGWIIESHKQAEEYQGRFKRTIETFIKIIGESVRGLDAKD